MNFLPQRRSRLLLRSAAPQLFGETAAQHRPWRRQGDTGQQRSGLASGRQNTLATDGPSFHLANQPQPHNNMVERVGGSRQCRDPRWSVRHHSSRRHRKVVMPTIIRRHIHYPAPPAQPTSICVRMKASAARKASSASMAVVSSWYASSAGRNGAVTRAASFASRWRMSSSTVARSASVPFD